LINCFIGGDDDDDEYFGDDYDDGDFSSFYQASLESELNKSKELRGFVSLCREIMTRFIELHFPTKFESQVSHLYHLCLRVCVFVSVYVCEREFYIRHLSLNL